LLWMFVYLIARNLFALIWLLARPRRSKELEILLLRHELAVLRRHAGRAGLTGADRALLAALSRVLPRAAWTGLVKPETLLGWHRQLVARRWTHAHRNAGRPPLEHSLRKVDPAPRPRESALAVQPDRRRAQRPRDQRLGDIGAQATARGGLRPAPERTRSSRRGFLRPQAASMLACDFLTVETAFLQRIYVLVFISLVTRRIEYGACSANQDGRWIAQQARNLVIQLGDEQQFRFLIHDRNTKFSHGFDEAFRSEGIRVIPTPVQAPNANAYAERWVRTLRADCLDRILIVSRRHLEHVLRVYRHH
jgi:putative transposase